MLIGKNTRRVSHNLIISKYFEEENNDIQNQYFVRNAADELSVISLGFGGFFVVINPCTFDIEYSSDTFNDMNDINLVEVAKFEAKAATVFRIEGQTRVPEFNFEYIANQLETEEERNELQQAIANITGVNDQYSVEQGSLGTSFDSIELNAEAVEAANYKHLDISEYNTVAIEDKASELEAQIAKQKQELEKLNQQVLAKATELNQAPQSEADTTTSMISSYESDIEEFEKELNELADFLDPDDLFTSLGLDYIEETETKDV